MEIRNVTVEMGKKLADEFKISYFESSTLTGQGIKEGFEHLVNDIMKKRGLWKENNEQGGMTLYIRENKKISKCH